MSGRARRRGPGRAGGRPAEALTPTPPAGIKIPEGCVRRVLQELQLMDADVKRKSVPGRAFPAPPPALGPLALPVGPGEVLDLTLSPPAAFPPPSPFAFPPPPPDRAPGGLLLGAPDVPADPAALVQQGCDINFKEVLEDMLRSLNSVQAAEPAVPLGNGAGAAGGGGGPERQSVIHFSPHFPNS